jgi:hypothetical protein
VRNACTRAGDRADRKRFKLARDVRAVEEGVRRELNVRELKPVLYEWHRLSQPFLDPAKTRDDQLAMFLKELAKVRVPTGGRETLTKALESISKLSNSELPLILAYSDAPEEWRRIAALHRELSRLCANGTYFLSYRDAAQAYDGLSHQSAYDITFALVRFGVIKIVRKGKAGLKSRKAAEFRYLLPHESVAEDDDEGLII